MLYIIGIGLNDAKDVTVKGLETIKQCSKLYLETYTSVLQCSVEDLEKFYNKKIIRADRELVEKKAEIIIKDAEKEDVALLIIGDPLSATTHLDMVMRAKEKGIKTGIIHNASVITAVGQTGLELYKFGKTTSVPFPEDNFKPETPYDVLKDNQKIGLHTLMLLDLRPPHRFMKTTEAIQYLLSIEEKRKEKVFTEEKMCVCCSALGSDKQEIVYGSVKELKEKELKGKPQCLIIPGKLHFVEEEFLKNF